MTPVSDPASDRPEGTARIGGFTSRLEAEIARTFLEAEGIATAVSADDAATGSFDVSFGRDGAVLIVAVGDEQRARELLAEVRASADGHVDPHRSPTRSSGTTFGGLAAALIALALLVVTVLAVVDALP